MIIELLGQPASGKSFVTREIQKELSLLVGFPVYAPEFVWERKNKIQKAFSLGFWYIFNFGFLFNKQIRNAVSIIKHQQKRKKGSRHFIYSLFLHYYFIKKSKNYYKNSIILFSENVVNISAYILRGNLTEETSKVFIDIYIKEFGANVSINFVYVYNELIRVIEKKQKRFDNLNETTKDYILKDVKSNIDLFNILTNLPFIKERTIPFKNSYDSDNESKENINKLCNLLVGNFKEKNNHN